MMDPYATHLPVLHSYVQPGDRAVEFGMGIYSTPFLLSRCHSVMSVEQSSPEWLGQIQELTGSPAHWTPVLAGGSDFMVVEYPAEIDVAFIDGSPPTRWACICLMMQLRARTIIAHDTEKPYDWERIRIAGYSRTIHKELTPWTTVWQRY
jgi:hypothetical protein